MTRNLVSTLRTWSEDQPDKPYLICCTGDQDVVVTYGLLFSRASRMAGGLARHGVKAGDPVLIFLDFSPDMYFAFFGAILLGAVPGFMPCPSRKQNPKSYWRDHLVLVKRINAAAIVTNAQNASVMEDLDFRKYSSVLLVEDIDLDGTDFIPSDPDEDNAAFLQHSSGTTSTKKGVILSHRAVFEQVNSYSKAIGATGNDRVASWLPVYHDMGLIACTIAPVILGQTVVCMDPFDWLARPSLLIEKISEYCCDWVWLPNFAFDHLARTSDVDSLQCDLSGVRAFINCSEPCKVETFERFYSKFSSLGVTRSQLQICYAMAETVFAVAQTRPGVELRPLRVDAVSLAAGFVKIDDVATDGLALLPAGTVIDGLRVDIRDETRVPLPEGRVGEICVSGSCLFDGYLRLEETTRDRLINGIYATRDMGFVWNKNVYILGRKDDLLIISGRNIYAHEIEAVMNDVLGVKPGRAVALGLFNSDVGTQELVVVAELGRHAVLPGSIRLASKQAILSRTNLIAKDVFLVEPGWLVKTTSGKFSRSKNLEKYRLEKSRLEMRENVR